MKRIIDFAKNWTLPLAIVIGTAGFPVWGYFSFLLPYLIFAMLLLTFCRIPLSEIRFNAMHFWLLAFQLGGSILAYVIVSPFNTLLAEAAMVCVIAPTGTAAAVITRKLGGSAASLTSFAILSNLGTAVAAPILFPIVHPAEGNIGFLAAFFIIIQKVFPLLILPFILAMLLRRFTPRLNEKLSGLQEWAFYMWGITLMIAVAKTVNSLVHDPDGGMTAVWLGLTALVVCILQFVAGKQLGGRFFQDRITGGQALGQKNAVLSLWMADTYLTPIASVAASAYLVSQNLFNSWQLWMTRKEQGKNAKTESMELPVLR
ncbi:transporter [Oxalobacter sp. OttesenSCG-928-P03]|nr:transporter [Oxalobacter sp. OttesenSCG-928-P03]